MTTTTKIIGYSLIAVSIILLIVLIAVKSDVDDRDAKLCLAYSEANLDMTSCPAHTSHTSWYITSAFVIDFILLVAGISLVFFSQREERKSSTKKVELSKLDEEEKKIVELIKSKEGSAYQSDLIKETEWSKVKVTRILDKLEGKGIIERKRRGMTNIIILK